MSLGGIDARRLGRLAVNKRSGRRAHFEPLVLPVTKQTGWGRSSFVVRSLVGLPPPPPPPPGPACPRFCCLLASNQFKVFMVRPKSLLLPVARAFGGLTTLDGSIGRSVERSIDRSTILVARARCCHPAGTLSVEGRQRSSSLIAGMPRCLRLSFRLRLRANARCCSIAAAGGGARSGRRCRAVCSYVHARCRRSKTTKDGRRSHLPLKLLWHLLFTCSRARDCAGTPSHPNAGHDLGGLMRWRRQGVECSLADVGTSEGRLHGREFTSRAEVIIVHVTQGCVLVALYRLEDRVESELHRLSRTKSLQIPLRYCSNTILRTHDYGSYK
jgi:hypothetical protein